MRTVQPPNFTRGLVSAAGAGDAARVESLLAAGADVNAAHDGGDTALMRAASKGHLQIVGRLIEAGADPNAERDDGFNALALAVLFGHSDVVRALLGGGADPSTVGPLGTTAEEWARFRGFDEIAGMLEDSRRARRQHSTNATGDEESGATLLFPPEGDFNVVVPLSEIGTAQKSGVAELKSGSAAEGLTSRGPARDGHEEVTLVPARAARPAKVFRPKGMRPSWPVLIAALVLSVAAGLTAGTYLIKSA
ncbi:MAG TPA: ankyrin repeat domain-containing protein, partial [Pyrinomonadaceae bacterium]|nr:ankyrin repeat domain-containing protein [Pyrinomonadaceae bacterium]